MAFFTAARIIAKSVGKALLGVIKSRKARQAAQAVHRAAKNKRSFVSAKPFSKVKRVGPTAKRVAIGVGIGLAAEPVISGTVRGVKDVVSARKKRQLRKTS